MMSNRTEDDYRSYPEFKAGVMIWKTVSPVLIIFGTIGNILTVVILSRRSIRKTTTGLFLIFLTISDLIVLYTGLLRQWLIYLFDFDVRQVGELACKVHTWSVSSSLDFSAWMLIAVTLERITAVWYPYKTRNKCSRKNAAILAIMILIVVLGLNSHFLYGYVSEISANAEGRNCVRINDSYSVFINTVWSWIDLCVFCLIPFTVIVVGNSLIVYKVFKSRRKAKPKLIPKNSALCRKDKRQTSMTTILVTLNTVFLLTTLPISVYNIGHVDWSSTSNQLTIARLELWWAIVNMLMYTSNALNFLLYSVSGSHFRREVRRTLCQYNLFSEANSNNVALMGCASSAAKQVHVVLKNLSRTEFNNSIEKRN